MKKQYIKDGVIIREGAAIVLNGMKIINPTAEQYSEAGWVEYTPPAPKPYVPTYEEKVEMFIRERYTISDELAIQRQRDTKPEDFAEYFAFCEDCKRRAKEE